MVEIKCQKNKCANWKKEVLANPANKTILRIFIMKRVSVDKIMISALFPGFISVADRIKNNNRKNAEAATHAGIISIIIPLKRMMLSATVVGENIDKIPLEALIVNGVKILSRKK